MLLELVCRHVEKKQTQYMFLFSDHYRIGKALDNDLILLESDALPYTAVLEKKGSAYFWKESGLEVDLSRESHQKHGYEFSIRDRKRWMYGLLFGFVLWIALLLVPGPSVEKVTGIPQLPAKGKYGRFHPNDTMSSVKFQFQRREQGFAMLHFTPGNIDSKSDLRVIVNDRVLLLVPSSPNRWDIERSIQIPANLFREANNNVVFEFRGKKGGLWGVKDIYLTYSHTPSQEKDVNDDLKLAQKLFNERGMRKGNLVRSIQALERAEKYFRMQKQDLPGPFQDLWKKVQQEKRKMIDEQWILAQKFKQGEEYSKAKRVLGQLLEELTDPLDPDRGQVEREIRSIP